MRKKSGYSLIVLIIAIAVIIILTSVTVTTLTTSKDTIEASNFIYDLTTVSEAVRQYASRNGSIPIESNTTAAIPTGMINQLNTEDNEIYYNINLAKLQDIVLKDYNRGYIVNEQTLNVYCETPLEYNGIEHYTLTNDLIKISGDYEEREEEIVIIGNPVNWTNVARMRLVIPKKANEVGTGPKKRDWSEWKFIFGFGPRTAEEMLEVSNSQGEEEEQLKNYRVKEFNYGDTLVAKTNGVYTIYVKEPDTVPDSGDGRVTLLNVVVSKIDDIAPKCALTTDFGGNPTISISDDETGIKGIYFKTKEAYNNNCTQAEADENATVAELKINGRTNIDFYLLNGIGEDLINDMPENITIYKSSLAEIELDRQEEMVRYESATEEEKLAIQSEHDEILAELNEKENALKERYPYIANPLGTTEKSKLVLYVLDNAGNATVIGDESASTINLKLLSDKYNLGL